MKLLHLLAIAAFVPVLSSAADLSGTWRLENTFNGQVSVINCTLVQKGEALAGSCKPEVAGMEASSLRGTFEGATAKWGYELVFNGRPARVDYEMTLAADGSLAGVLLRNGSGSPIKGRPATAGCDRACLQKWVDDYLLAMRDQKVDPALFAADVRFTENGVQLPFGKEGLWYAMSGIGNYKFYVPDIDTQQVAFLGTVRERGKTQTDGDLLAIALRLKIRNQRITEIEQIVSRPSNVNSSRGDFPPTGQGMEAMGAPHPIFTTPIPEKERMSRAELIETANYYFTGLENNDGKGYYPFTEDCVRFENAVDVLALGGTRTTCKKQFEEGLKGIVDRVRDRRFVAVDRERGIAFAFAFFDHHRINWTWQIAELFRMENGRIRRIEAIFHQAPFGMPSGWSTYQQAMSSDIQDVR